MTKWWQGWTYQWGVKPNGDKCNAVTFIEQKLFPPFPKTYFGQNIYWGLRDLQALMKRGWGFTTLVVNSVTLRTNEGPKRSFICLDWFSFANVSKCVKHFINVQICLLSKNCSEFICRAHFDALAISAVIRNWSVRRAGKHKKLTSWFSWKYLFAIF